MEAPSIEEMRMRREVLALREALENAQVEHDVHSSRATSAHRGELEELHAMVRSLRELVDTERASSTQALGELRRQLATEIRALQSALSEARSAFDEERIALQASHQAEMLAAGRIRAELESTIKHLRERIDAGG